MTTKVKKAWIWRFLALIPRRTRRAISHFGRHNSVLDLSPEDEYSEPWTGLAFESSTFRRADYHDGDCDA